jgi:SAM-dependent methyltransferase
MDKLFRLSVDTDLLMPEKGGSRPIPFVQSDVYHLPFKADSFDLVLMRFVAEHIADPGMAFREIHRILKPGGWVLILTTNRTSPLIFLPSVLIPYRIRKYLMKKIYGVSDDDVFPTFHRLNTGRAFKKLRPEFTVVKTTYLQDINWNRRWLFTALYLFHLKTKILHLKFLRSNLLVVLQKSTV